MKLRCPGCRKLFDTDWIGDELDIMCSTCIWNLYRPHHREFLGGRLRELFAKRSA